MLNFFKSFGKGILYVLVLPFLLVGLALYGVVAIFIFIFLAIKGLVLFFTGRSLDDELPEDKKARLIKEGQTNTATGPIIEQPVYINTQQVSPQPEPQKTTIEEAVFGQSQERQPFEDEIKTQPEPVQEERTSEEIFESILSTEPKEEEYRNVNIEPEQDDEEPIGQYIPHKSTQRIVEDNEEEEEDHSATNIYFGGDND